MLEYDEEMNIEDRLFHAGYQIGHAIGVYEGLVKFLRPIYKRKEKEVGPERADEFFLQLFGHYAFAKEFLHFIRKYPDLSDLDFADRLAAETEFFPGDI